MKSPQINTTTHACLHKTLQGSTTDVMHLRTSVSRDCCEHNHTQAMNAMKAKLQAVNQQATSSSSSPPAPGVSLVACSPLHCSHSHLSTQQHAPIYFSPRHTTLIPLWSHHSCFHFQEPGSGSIGRESGIIWKQTTSRGLCCVC